MNWDRIVVGFLDELEKVAAFNTSGLSPETVMEKSQPPPPMETAGFNKARDILGRASQTKTAASKEIQRALPNQPGVGKLIHQGDSSAPEQAKSVAGYGLAGLGTGAAVHKAYSTMPSVYDSIHKPGIGEQAKHLAGSKLNTVGRRAMLGGAAAGVAYGGYRAIKKRMARQPAQVKQGTITKLSYEIEPEDRPSIKKKDFAQPNKEEAGHKGKYPIPDRQHAKSALGFAKMHGDTAAYAAVRKKVKAKFPDMLQDKEKTSTVSSPGVALKASQQVGKKKVAPSHTGPNITTQIRGQLVGRKGVT